MKILFLAALLFSGTAGAQVDIDQALQIRNQRNIQTTPGMLVGRIDAAAVKNAAASIGGRVSIQFNKSESIDFTQAAAKSGGVIVGSGTDGAKKNILVTPPLRSSMSVTVSARKGAINESALVCVRLKKSNPLGGSNCGRTGTALRLLEAGDYILYLKGRSHLGLSTLEITVKPGDHLIIPAREIQIGAHKELFQYALYADYSSNYEIQKVKFAGPRALLDLYYRSCCYSTTWEAISKHVLSNVSGISFEIFLKNSSINNFGLLEIGQHNLPESYISPAEYRTVSTFIEFYFKSPPEAAFFNVLPGTYGIQWVFQDGQIDFTKGIVVE